MYQQSLYRDVQGRLDAAWMAASSRLRQDDTLFWEIRPNILFPDNGADGITFPHVPVDNLGCIDKVPSGQR